MANGRLKASRVLTKPEVVSEIAAVEPGVAETDKPTLC
jgi:hypothetical protein